MFHVDGVLFKNAFGTEEMRDIFEEEAFIERFLEVEAALARAEAEAGVVPENASQEITEKASLEYLDLDRVEENVADIGLFTMAIIDAWKEAFEGAGEYIHWGATSQDISDTAVVLQLRDGYDAVQRDLRRIRTELAELADTYAATPMIGRTHHVHAIPITFGLKVATWIDEIDRHLDRLDDLEDRLFVLEFFGATGTLSSLGEVGLEVQTHLSDELDLAVPDTAWFASRDRFAELLDVLSMIGSTLGKIASHVLLLNRPEIRELEEPIGGGKVGSSTMPHKKNPVKSETNVTLSKMLRAHAHLMEECINGYDERDRVTWYAEFGLIPEAFLYTGRILQNTIDVISDLGVKPARMERNLEVFGSLVTSEAVMMALADELGRQTAHEVVYENAMEAIEHDREFTECLKDDDRIASALSDDDIETLTDPRDYTGLSERLVDDFLA